MDSIVLTLHHLPNIYFVTVFFLAFGCVNVIKYGNKINIKIW